MVLMSDKSKAKEVMKKAGVPVIEGSEGALSSPAEGKKLAKKIGYPVIVKASAGGGGRGMRVVEKEEDFETAYLAAQSESASAFGDGTLYMEKYIKDPRHIEVQIMGDSHGNAIHIGERDCSLQRRHQKLIEESPAQILDEKTRVKLHDVAVKATKFLRYENAGTFEFLLDSDKNFYFMEMNTRLQVEHCVSEMVSGLDIIELMIRVAEGEKVPRQENIILKGHSIECRITAEDSVKFIPSPGKLTKYIAPGGRNVRIDSHMYQGYTVPSHYDSMIGKLIVWAESRDKAIAKMKNALSELQIEGIKTVRDFHLKMMDNPDFKSNNFDTNYLSKY
jgi:acetyl-CoA carboxylase biotin carboxylase subunit